MNLAIEHPFVDDMIYYFGFAFTDTARYLDNVAGLFIARQFSALELRDDVEEMTDLNI